MYCACSRVPSSPIFFTFILVVEEQTSWIQFCILIIFKMAEVQVKKGQKQASGCAILWWIGTCIISLLGVDSSNSASTSSSAANPSFSVASTPSSDALQLIMAKLDNMQGRLSSLEKASVSTTSTSTFTSSASSKEVVTAEFSSDQEGDRDLLRYRHGSRHLQTEEDDFFTHGVRMGAWAGGRAGGGKKFVRAVSQKP